MSFPPVLSDVLTSVRRALYKRGLASDAVDDLVQEAYRRLEVYKKNQVVERPEGFLVRTAVNLSIDQARQQARNGIAAEPVEEFSIVDEAPGPDEVYDAKQKLERLNEGFQKLDPLTRQMLKAQRLDGERLSTIADRHGMSVSAVEKRIAKGIAILAEWMEGW
ncbi:RNA polymerase sigma factor [Hyphococcus sp. DH-69]|uniref:RNA polymerase sigma factor n=1 Tax=Hyphococcus formosus TaxID=3143534 RepID=UPI00398AE73D